MRSRHTFTWRSWPRIAGKSRRSTTRPGLRPNYHANYFAAFVIGPDGHNIEVVCHEPEA
jgi:hypothetical protein